MNTKTRFLITLFISAFACFLIQDVSAQRTPARAGIKGGLNVSNLYAENVDDENARFGFNAGLWGQVLSTPGFALQPELLYTTKGAETVSNSIFATQKVRFNLNYVEVPLLAVFKLGPSAEIHAGGYGGYLTQANLKFSGDFANGTEELNRSNFKTADAGLVGGFGLNFGNVHVGARYNYGLVEIADSDAARNILGDSKNSSASVYMAINLNRNNP